MATETVPVPATASDALHGQASDAYDVLALLDALISSVEHGFGETGQLNADTITRLANLAHTTLSDIKDQLFEIVDKVRAMEVANG